MAPNVVTIGGATLKFIAATPALDSAKKVVIVGVAEAVRSAASKLLGSTGVCPCARRRMFVCIHGLHAGAGRSKASGGSRLGEAQEGQEGGLVHAHAHMAGGRAHGWVHVAGTIRSATSVCL